MTATTFEGPGARVPFMVGFVAALAAALLIGEAYARLAPPQDVREHFVPGPLQRGIYRPDPDLGADYRSYEDFRAENAARLAELGALDAKTPTWLFLGNSFVQGTDMLADTAQKAAPEMRVFHLRRNVDLPLRAAQARLLLDAGLRPERIFFVLLPHDLWQIGSRPLAFISVTSEGAIATRVRWPDEPLRLLTDASRLASIAWLRSGRAAGDPSFSRRAVADAPSVRAMNDLHAILRVLADSARRHGVPVTVVAIPNREQIFGRSGMGFQDALKDICDRLGVDLYDAGPPLAGAADKPSLFMPDWHLSPRGNEILWSGLAGHLKARPGMRR
jgi:hypothetical protein